MITITNKAKCCGCGACAQVCPKACITMKPDAEGFLYPTPYPQICVQCGICEQVCPVLNAEDMGENVMQTIVGYHRQMETRLASSSGGIFSLIAESVLQQGGKVYGVSFDENFQAHHIGIDNISSLQSLQGSKYMQSRIEQTYQQVRSDLQTGRLVLFSGVACQIAGLKHYLKQDYSNLITIDVLCHGVPSPLVWKNYLEWQSSKYQDDVKTVFFRKKNQGWKHYEVELHFSHGEVYHQPFYHDPFMRLFLSNICLRPSCYQCCFKTLERQSDITLGDCWGIQDYLPQMDDDQGTSVILIHTECGHKIISQLFDQMYYQQAETDRALPPTADSRKSVAQHPKRKQFFNQIAKSNDMDKIVKLIRPKLTMRMITKLKRFVSK